MSKAVASKPTVVRKKKRLLTDKRCEHCGHVTRWPCKSSDAIAICHLRLHPKHE